MNYDHAPTSSGYEVPLAYFGAEGDSLAHLLLLPALGIEARLYRRLGESLAARGVDVALLEQRGQGQSAVRPSRKVDFGWREMLQEDIPAALAWLRERSAAGKTLLLGHSLGGHHAAITAGLRPGEVHGLVLAATGTPWIGAYEGKTARSIRLLTTIAGPLGALAGHYPGKTVGFGGREARGVMADWVSLARDNRYRARGLDQDLDAPIASYAGPVLAMRMADDTFGPESAVEAVLEKFRDAPITRAVLSADDIGGPADHYGWAKHPDAAATRIVEWLTRDTDHVD